MPRRSMKDEVVRAAAELIAERGLGAISLADVAAAAGIRTTSVYRIFRDKDLLFDAVLAFALKHLEGLGQEIFQADASVEEKIKSTVYSYAHHTLIGKLDRRLLFRALADGDHATLKRIAEFRGEGIRAFVALIGSVVGPERAWPVYFVITGLSTGLMHMQPFHEFLHPGIDAAPEPVATAILTLAIPGIDWANVRVLVSF